MTTDLAKRIRDLLDSASLDKDERKMREAAGLIDSMEFLALTEDQQTDLCVLYSETFFAVTGAYAA